MNDHNGIHAPCVCACVYESKQNKVKTCFKQFSFVICRLCVCVCLNSPNGYCVRREDMTKLIRIPLCRVWFSSSMLFMRETSSWSPACEDDCGEINTN